MAFFFFRTAPPSRDLTGNQNRIGLRGGVGVVHDFSDTPVPRRAAFQRSWETLMGVMRSPEEALERVHYACQC